MSHSDINQRVFRKALSKLPQAIQFPARTLFNKLDPELYPEIAVVAVPFKNNGEIILISTKGINFKAEWFGEIKSILDQIPDFYLESLAFDIRGVLWQHKVEILESVRKIVEGKNISKEYQSFTIFPEFMHPSVSIIDETLRSMFVDPADALAEARQMGAPNTDAWRQHLSPMGVNVPLRPLTPLKIGHMNSIIAAGHLNNQVLNDENGQRLLIKGRSYKTTREESYEEPLPSGGRKLTTMETEVVVTDITTVDEKGEVQSHNGPGLEQFLSRWIGKLTGTFTIVAEVSSK